MIHLVTNYTRIGVKTMAPRPPSMKLEPTLGHLNKTRLPKRGEACKISALNFALSRRVFDHWCRLFTASGVRRSAAAGGFHSTEHAWYMLHSIDSQILD